MREHRLCTKQTAVHHSVDCRPLDRPKETRASLFSGSRHWLSCILWHVDTERGSLGPTASCSASLKLGFFNRLRRTIVITQASVRCHWEVEWKHLGPDRHSISCAFLVPLSFRFSRPEVHTASGLNPGFTVTGHKSLLCPKEHLGS